jgi:hypothetical protein
LSHGVVKLWLIIGLLRQKLWYYPLAAAVFGLFIVYQYSFTNSLWLLVLSAVDVAVIALTWHEYRYLRSGLSSAGIRQGDRGVIRGDRDTISIEISARNSHKGDAGMTVI